MSVEVSVVIPVYKAEKTIEKCVHAILKNGNPSMEILLVEDCSPDNSLEICEKLAKENPMVHLLKNEINRGVSYTRNRGLGEAKGKYIMFADSDDWTEEAFSVLPVKVMNETGAEMVVFGYVNHDEVHNHTTENFCWSGFTDTKKVSYQTELMKLYTGRLLQQLWNKVFLSSIIKQNEIAFDESSSMGEDFRFILDYLQHCESKQLMLLNKVLYHYNRDNENSLMYTFEYKDVEEPLKDMEKLYHLAGYSTEETKEEIRKERDRIMTQYAYFIMHSPAYSTSDKKERILALGDSTLYKKMKRLYLKEKIISILK